MTDELVFPVPEAIAKSALIDKAKYQAWYKKSIEDPEGFWGEHGKRLDWMKPFTKVKDVSFNAPDVHIRWFYDGTLNVSHNCLDRHLAKRGDQTAILFEGDDPSVSKAITYRQLHEQVCKFANALKSIGVKKGDRVTIYLPMIPELAVAMLACTRIGAIHSIVFGGFSPDSLANRIQDCDSTVLVTADEGLRGGRKVALKKNADQALQSCPTIGKVVVVKHTGGACDWKAGRDAWWHELMANASADCPPEEMNAEDPLFILYTSGSTGKPKGVLHTTGGYLVYVAMTHQYVFDYHDGDVYWCTADIGWVTGHSYIVYGPLANGAISVMFEGVPNYPDASRFWQVVDKHQVNIIYTAPTAIRALMREGEGPVKKTSRKSLRILGTVGEPINPEAWMWYYTVVGEGRCPIVDTWWQTETGGILITPLPGAIALKPGSATLPFFGVQPCIVDADGKALEGSRHRQSVHVGCLARHHAHRLPRPRSFRADVLLDLPRQVLHRRRLSPRRGRLLLDHRTGRRRHQRLRSPHGHGRGGERAGGAPEGGGGGGGGLPARPEGPGHLCVRDAQCRRESVGGVAHGAGRLGAQGDRADRLAGRDPMGAGAAEDSIRQDHAANFAQDRRERRWRARRHIDARRSHRRRRPDRAAGDGVRRTPATPNQLGGTTAVPPATHFRPRTLTSPPVFRAAADSSERGLRSAERCSHERVAAGAYPSSPLLHPPPDMKMCRRISFVKPSSRI